MAAAHGGSRRGGPGEGVPVPAPHARSRSRPRSGQGHRRPGAPPGEGHAAPGLRSPPPPRESRQGPAGEGPCRAVLSRARPGRTAPPSPAPSRCRGAGPGPPPAAPLLRRGVLGAAQGSILPCCGRVLGWSPILLPAAGAGLLLLHRGFVSPLLPVQVAEPRGLATLRGAGTGRVRGTGLVGTGPVDLWWGQGPAVGCSGVMGAGPALHQGPGCQPLEAAVPWSSGAGRADRQAPAALLKDNGLFLCCCWPLVACLKNEEGRRFLQVTQCLLM